MATTLNFPANLPLPLRDGYELNHASPFARTEMANGRARQRRTFTSVPSMVSVSFIFDAAEGQLFEAWFKYDADDGAAWFNCRLDSPDGLKDYECRFTGMYQGPQLVGTRYWRYTAEFEILERPVVSELEYQFGADDIFYTSIFDITMNDQWPEA